MLLIRFSCSLRSFFWGVFTHGFPCRVVQIPIAKYLDERQNPVKLLRVPLHPDLASGFFSKLNQFVEFSFLLLELRQEIRCGTEVTAGVTR